VAKERARLRQAASSQHTRHQAGNDQRQSLGEHRKQAQTHQRKTEEVQADSLQKRCERGISHKSPVEVTRIAKELEFVPVKTIPAISGQMRQQNGRRDAKHNGQSGPTHQFRWFG